ncbi:DUF488 domain-containing protein [Candidatus Saccharibacteria bacterium]|nr:DUF488 domain-containing protein [Candidatus Saccharibacteria bacterium]MCB9821674.1 DUF488 domain-containing protein [Candidatus Nomurabacteria bacterium]
MSRHTLEDGATPDPEIHDDLYDEWWPELAPPARLVGAYYKRGLSWREFEQEYQNFLRRPEVARKITELIDLARNCTVTILCVEDKPDQCHRRLLAEACLEAANDLEVVIQ